MFPSLSKRDSSVKKQRYVDFSKSPKSKVRDSSRDSHDQGIRSSTNIEKKLERKASWSEHRNDFDERLSAKGWRAPNSRRNLGVSNRMVRAFGFAHSLEVIDAKISLRLAISTFEKFKTSFKRPKDFRAVRFLRTRVIKKLNIATEKLTSRRAFFRWNVFSKPQLLRHCIAKIALNSRISHPIAIYRFKAVVDQFRASINRYTVYEPGLHEIIKSFSKIYEKNNSVSSVVETAFAKIKDHYIRCSKLINLESIVQKIIKRRSPVPESFLQVKKVAKLKYFLCKRLTETSKIKQLRALEKLKRHSAGFNADLLRMLGTEEDVDIIKNIYKKKVKERFEEIIKNIRKKDEDCKQLNEAVKKLFHKRMRQVLRQVDTKVHSEDYRTVRFCDALDKLFNRRTSSSITEIIKKSSKLPSDQEKEMIFRESPKLQRRDQPLRQMTIAKKIAPKKLTHELIEKVKRVNTIITMVENLEINRYRQFWREFMVLERAKEMRAVRNYFNKWVIKMFGQRAKERLRQILKIVSANHLINTVLRRNGKSDMKKCLRDIKTHSYIKYQLSKQVNFQRDIPMIKNLCRLFNNQTKKSFYNLMLYSQMSNAVKNADRRISRTSNSTVVTTTTQGEVPTARQSEVADAVVNSIQEQRVRRRNLKPIFTSYKAEDHKTISSKIVPIEEEKKEDIRVRIFTKNDAYDTEGEIVQTNKNSNFMRGGAIFEDITSTETENYEIKEIEEVVQNEVERRLKTMTQTTRTNTTSSKNISKNQPTNTTSTQQTTLKKTVSTTSATPTVPEVKTTTYYDSRGNKIIEEETTNVTSTQQRDRVGNTRGNDSTKTAPAGKDYPKKEGTTKVESSSNRRTENYNSNTEEGNEDNDVTEQANYYRGSNASSNTNDRSNRNSNVTSTTNKVTSNTTYLSTSTNAKETTNQTSPSKPINQERSPQTSTYGKTVNQTSTTSRVGIGNIRDTASTQQNTNQTSNTSENTSSTYKRTELNESSTSGSKTLNPNNPFYKPVQKPQQTTTTTAQNTSSSRLQRETSDRLDTEEAENYDAKSSNSAKKATSTSKYESDYQSTKLNQQSRQPTTTQPHLTHAQTQDYNTRTSHVEDHLNASMSSNTRLATGNANELGGSSQTLTKKVITKSGRTLLVPEEESFIKDEKRVTSNRRIDGNREINETFTETTHEEVRKTSSRRVSLGNAAMAGNPNFRSVLEGRNDVLDHDISQHMDLDRSEINDTSAILKKANLESEIGSPDSKISSNTRTRIQFPTMGQSSKKVSQNQELNDFTSGGTSGGAATSGNQAASSSSYIKKTSSSSSSTTQQIGKFGK